MKKAEIKIGGHYAALVSGRMAVVRIDRVSPHGGWEAVNVKSLRSVRVRSAQRLRFEAVQVDGRWCKKSDATSAELDAGGEP
jgi:hypothetical protein